MSFFRDDKVVQIHQYEKLNTMGRVFEVGDITDKSVVIRDAKSKVAIAAIDINDFEKYFVREDKRVWTDWCNINDEYGNIIARFRTNRKKVQVVTNTGSKGESSCNNGDMFNLNIGIRIAYLRARRKYYQKNNQSYTTAMIQNENQIKDIESQIESIIKTNVKSKE